MKKIIFHVFAWLQTIAALTAYKNQNEEETIESDFSLKCYYLSFINLHLQLLLYTIYIFEDFFYVTNGFGLFHWFRRLRNLVYASLSMPYSIIVAGSFWVFYICAPAMLYSEEQFDNVSYSHHLWHTIILLPVLDLGISRHKYPNRFIGLFVCEFFGVGYLITIIYVKQVQNIWVFSFLEELNYFLVFLFFLFALAIFALAYTFGEYLNSFSGITAGVSRVRIDLNENQHSDDVHRDEDESPSISETISLDENEEAEEEN